jgi:hypothetical protein
MKTVARFRLRQGERATFVLNYRASHQPAPPMLDAQAALETTERAWAAWSARSRYDGRWPDAVMRSLITLKALIYEPTGGIRRGADHVAARAVRRRAQLGLPLLLAARRDLHVEHAAAGGYTDEAVAWCKWLLRAVAGSAKDLQDAVRRRRPARLPESSSAGCPGTTARRRCASATPRPNSSSSTCTAK